MAKSSARPQAPKRFARLAELLEFGKLGETPKGRTALAKLEKVASLRRELDEFTQDNLRISSGPEISAWVRQTERRQEISSARLEDEYHRLYVERGAPLTSVWRAALKRFPHPSKPGFVGLTLRDDIIFSFPNPGALLQAVQAVRRALRVCARRARKRTHDVFDLASPASPLRVEVTPDGKFHAPQDLLRDGLISVLEGCEAWRIGICRNCAVLFLAKRHDQKACGGDCAKTYRSKQFRTSHPGYYARCARRERAQRARTYSVFKRRKLRTV
jgi:hypothetical protein